MPSGTAAYNFMVFVFDPGSEGSANMSASRKRAIKLHVFNIFKVFKYACDYPFASQSFQAYGAHSVAGAGKWDACVDFSFFSLTRD